MTGQERAARVRRMRTTAPAAATPRALRDRAARPYVLNGHSTSAPPLPAGPYLVATPLGNFRDITDGGGDPIEAGRKRSEEHTTELQSHSELVCRPLLDNDQPTMPGVRPDPD